MSLATTSAQQSALANANANASAAGPAAASPASGANASSSALGSLSGNFSSFLKLLMTQLQNQDPTSPLDTNQFTSQLVQYSSVEQQINTNTSLTQLIQLTQSGALLQSSAMVGRQVSVASDHLPLQSGKGGVQFTAQAAGPVAIAVYSDAGTKLANATVLATKGANSWNWDGTNLAGNTVPDGSYKVAVMGADAAGHATALPFTVTGTATGVSASGNSLQLTLGQQSVDFSTVRSVGK